MSDKNRLYVDVKRIIGTIDPNIYGFNIEHFTPLQAPYGAIFDEDSPLSDEQGFRRDVVDVCKRIKVPLIRWPGGNFASGYHWLDGVGPRADRSTRYNFAWKTEETNRFGTDEFIEFCRLIGAEPFITVNAGSGTAEEAASWVEYCNRKGKTYYAQLRAKNGHPEPYGVTYWSIGNEMWGDFQTGGLPAAEYACKAREYGKLMKKVDPTIKLTVVGNPLSRQTGGLPDWDYTLLRNLGNPFIYHNEAIDLLDTVSTHVYYHRFLSGDEAEDYYRVLAFPVDLEQQLNRKKCIIEYALSTSPSQLESSRRPFPNIRDKTIGISLDEWGLSRGATLRDALGMARVLNVCQKLSDTVKIGCPYIFQTRQDPVPDEAVSGITVYPDALGLGAGYYVYDLYVNHTGQVALDSYVASATYDLEFAPGGQLWNSWDARWYGLVSFKEVPYLDCSASTNSAGTIVYLATINAHRDEDQDCLIELRGCSPQPTGRVFELNAPDVNAYNSRESKDNVKISQKSNIPVTQRFTYTFPAHSVTVIEISVD